MRLSLALRLACTFLFCSGLFPGHFLYRLLSKFGRFGLLKLGVRIEGTAKSIVRRYRFIYFGVGFIVCWKLWEQFFFIFAALETGLKIDGFSMV